MRHRSSSGLSALQLLRDTALVRRNTRRARISVSVVAVTAALTIVSGMAPAYAEEAPAPAAVTKETSKDSEPGKTVVKPSPTAQPAAQGPKSGGPKSKLTDRGTAKKAAEGARIAARQAIELAAEAPENPSWIWQGGAPTQNDGEKDTTAYGGGSSEATDPATWTQASADTPKADLLKYYLNVDASGDVIVSFGFTRKANTGDTAFAVEFNQLANASNSPPRPNRTPGDLLLKFHVDSGNAPLAFAHAYLWTAAADFGDYPLGCFSPAYTGGAFGWCEISKAGFEGRSADDSFTAEGRVNLTTLFEHNNSCSGFFSAVNLRGESSAENWTNSLQDYLGTPGASVPSTCANLVIRKYADGTSTLLPGAEFDVYAGTGTGGTLLYDNIKDGHPADSDPDVGEIAITGIEPGTYTVVEVVAPTGYFLPADPEQTLTVGDSGTITFDFHDVKKWLPLDITKDGSGAYTAKYNWDIQKKVAADLNSTWMEELVKNVPDDGEGSTDASFAYQVVVTQGTRETSGIKATGNVYVDNPNNAPVDVTLTDTMAGATCTFADPTVSVPAGAVDQAYAYECTYPANTAPASLATTNNVKVEWDRSTYPQVVGDIGAEGSFQDTAQATIGWTATEINKTVTITDDHHPSWAPDYTDPWTITWTGQGVQETRTYTRSISSGAGNCHTEVNTAFVKDGQATLDQDSATAGVCVGKNLDITKVSKESLTRTYDWDITKSSNEQGPVMVDPVTGKASASFDILVEAGDFEDSAWLMSGTITVSNPNFWEDIVITGLTDVYSGGDANDCAIDGWGSMSAADKTIPKRVGDVAGTKTFDYTCVFDSKPAYDGTNTATVTWDATTASTPSGTDSFQLPIAESDWTFDDKVHETVTIWDDNAGIGDPVQIGEFTWSEGFSDTITYTVHDLTAPEGDCQVWDNIATVNGDGGVELDTSTDDVNVCNPSGLELSKTVSGSYERTYDWDINKEVRAEAGPWLDAASWTGDSYSHPFEYRVTVTQLPWDDSEFVMEGLITLTNPNQDPAIDPISSTVSEVPDVGADATCLVNDGGAYDGEEIVGLEVGPIASGATLNLGYECTFADGDDPDYTGGTNNVTATNATPAEVSVDVDFVKGATHHETALVLDNKVDLLTPAQLGSVTYDEAVPDKATHFFYGLTHTVEETGCSDPFVNTATVGSEGVLHDTDTASAVVCPVPGTWRVEKISDSDGPVAVGSEITYTLKAIKTGGVNPEDVVVEDDLSALAPHVAIPDSFTPSVGTASVVDGVLVWNIPELSGTATLEFTVTVNDDAYDVHLPNLVTSPGSENCPDQDTATEADECTTDSDTPHYVLAKSSVPAPGSVVLPPYLGADGDSVTYTLTVTNDSDAPINDDTMPGASVTDDLSEVLDDATLVQPLAAGLTLDGTTLTWDLPDLAPEGQEGDSASISYTVTVNADAWNAELRNVATPGPGGDCVEVDGCETDHETPPYTQMQVKKVNAETGEALAGAEFTLYDDNEPFADPAAPVIGEEDEVIGTATSGDDGLAQFTAKLLRGHFLVQETEAPDGYALPVTGDTMAVVIDDANFAENTYMAPFEFRDPAEGQLAIVAKQQFEQDDAGVWQESDGLVAFGQEVRYVVQVEAIGPKIFHDVTVTDYVPGFNPDDVTSSAQASLVPGTAKCSDGIETCDVTVGDDGLVTWELGTVREEAGSIEMVVKFPSLPPESEIVYDANGVFTTTVWNVGYLAWDEVVFTDIPQEELRAAAKADLPMAHHELTSNEVVAKAIHIQVQPPVEPPIKNPPTNPPGNPPANPPTNPPTALPDTGGPAAWLPLTGIGLLVLGAWLMLQTRLRRRRA